jgi:hypothetical protein
MCSRKNWKKRRAEGLIAQRLARLVSLRWLLSRTVKWELLIHMEADSHGRSQAQDHGHQHETVPSDMTLRVKALESLLVKKGLIDLAASVFYASCSPVASA